LSEDKKRLALPDLFGEKNKNIETLKAEKCELERKIGDMEAEKHSRLVAEIVEARLEFGICKDGKAETERLLKLPDVALEILKEDTRKVIEKLASRRRLYR